MAITGQTPMNINTVIDDQLQGLSENVNVNIAGATASNPKNIMLIKNVRRRLFINFKSTQSAEVIVWLSSDRNADATDNSRTGNFAVFQKSPPTITVNDNGWFSSNREAVGTILVQAYPSTGVSGAIEISAHARMRED